MRKRTFPQSFSNILLAGIVWLATSMGISQAADAAPPLFGTKPTSAAKIGDASPPAIRDRQVTRARPVEIDLSVLSAAADRMGSGNAKPTISLNLFDDVTYIAEVDQVAHTERGLNLVGHLRGVDLSQVIIVANGDVVAGNISLPLGRYHIRYAGNGRHEVQAINQFLFPKDEPFVPVPDERALAAAVKEDVAARMPGAQADDGSNIDVMVVYTATTRAAAGGTAAMKSLIDLAITETNQSYQNSGINQRLRMVHSEEVAYTETGDLSDALNCITSTTDNCLDNVHTLRNTYGADLVSFWVEDGGNACGLGWLTSSVSSAASAYGFSAVARSCATGYYSFGHELGHNMGARHDVAVDTASTPYAYAHGYINTTATTPWRTIMAYNDGCAAFGKTCTRIQYWSNPGVSYGGVPMGDATADNHRTLNNTAATIANFRQAVFRASAAQALFVNASTSTNKTSQVRVINTSGSNGTLTATAYDENGNQLGSSGASLGSMSAYQTKTFSSAQIESMIGFTPASSTAKYSVYFSSDLPGFQVVNYTQDVATGALTLSQAQYGDRSATTGTGSVSRSAWFVSSSTSSNKTNVLRILNTSTQSGTLSATLYDEDGNLFGSGNTALGSIAPHQMISYTSAQLESVLGFTPISPTAKYRVVFTATVPSLELINFTKDIATGNLALVQAQVENRPSSSATTSTRNVLLVNPSTSSQRNTVLRIVNPNNATATVNATAYDEAGNQAGNGFLGALNANQILALTSAQIETALGYSPTSPNASYRLVITANVPTFEVIDNTKLPSNGNLYLAQAQTDNREASTATSTTRNAYIVYPSLDSANTTELRIINTTSQSAPLTATGYADNGTVVASNVSLGTLGANQMLTLTSAQLESAFGYTLAASARWRIAISAALSNFEVLNYAKSVSSGLLVLAQPQTE